MTLREFNEKYGELSKQYDALYHRVAQRYGFSDLQHWLLYILYSESREFTQNELAELFGLPKQSLNSAVARLQKLGYVTRAACPGPGNSKTVSLTPAGRELCLHCVEPLLRAEERALDRLTAEENEQFLRLYEKHYLAIREELGLLLKGEDA